MLNSVLLSSAQKIINSPAPSRFKISAKFLNKNAGSKFSFYPLMIDHLVLERDYVGKYSDEFDIHLKISPHDYALLQDQGQDLLCILTFTYVNQGGFTVYTPSPIQKQYCVTINNPLNIRQIIPDAQAHTTPSVDISMRLIEPAIYELRHKRLNTIFQNTTISQAIYGLTHLLDIDTIEMISPNNTHRYDQIDIPSYQGIESVYNYLQYKFGVYEKGFAAYITDGVLYVYPPYETTPSYPRTAIFYQVDQGRFAGAEIFHKVENDSVSIVVNSLPESQDLSILGAENVGTGFIFNRASRRLNGITSISGSDKTEYTDNPSLAISLVDPRTSVKGMNNIKHVRTTDNPYPHMSEIMFHQASLMNVQWPHADPFQLDPGHAITYYYDENETMIKKTGILEHATYLIGKAGMSGSADVFGVVGNLVLRLDRNTSKVI